MGAEFRSNVGLSVVVPVFNEEDGIAELLRRVTRACQEEFARDFEIILVNDGSTDASWGQISSHADGNSHVVGINLSRNYGHQIALSAGLEAASGRLVLVLDADLQDPPELLGPMIAKIREGYDVVYGRRAVRHGETAFKRGSAALFYRMLDRLMETKVPHDTGDFRLMTRPVVDQLNAMPERFRFVRGMVSWIGFRQTEISYERDVRFAGKTHYPLRKMLSLAVDAVTSFSIMPLRMASHLGFAFGCLGIVALLWVAASWLRGETIVGWASLAALVLIMGSAQLLVLGVFGEYLGRMYIESKRRPLFIVQEVRRSNSENQANVSDSENPVVAETRQIPAPAEFDIHAESYERQHANSLRLSGEDPAFFSQYKVAVVQRMLAARGKEPSRILDFGAGVGNALPFLQEHFPSARVTCLDVSAASLSKCEARAQRPAEFVVYDGQKIPFEDGTFDAVFTACVFHHIPPSKHLSLLAEIRRVLAADGEFFLFEHNPWNPFTTHAVRNCPFDANAILINAPEMRRRLKAAGFSDLNLSYHIFFPGSLSALRPAERLLRWFPIGAQYSLTTA